MASKNKKYFNKIICDSGELVINLTHVLTHHDLEAIQKIRNMFNETLCNQDNIKQAHMSDIDQKMKNLLSFQRLSLDIYTKLIDLREEDESKDTMSYLKKQQKLTNDNGLEEDNFFLEDEI